MLEKTIPRIKRSIRKRIIEKRRAVSPVLATIIIFGLIITGVMITFIQVVPYIEEAQSEQTVSTVTNGLLNLDSAIKDLISESGNPGGIRTILFNKPAGTLYYQPDFFSVSLFLQDQDDNPLHSIIDFQDTGALDWIYNSPRAILPRGAYRYLTGPNQFTNREPAFITGVFSTTDNHDLTNLTLSHQDDRKHHITLNYRISVYLTLTTEPTPEIRFQVFQISLATDFESIHSQYKRITVNVNQNISIPYTVPLGLGVTRIDLKLAEDYYETADTTSTLWSTREIDGSYQLSDFDIIVQLIRYEINLET